MIDRVTITGADDSVRPEDLIELTREFPFVEWGILASASSTGRAARYPSWEWMIKLQAITTTKCPMQLSLHLCGRWVRNLIQGYRDQQLTDATFFQFQRVQLNFHAERTKCVPSAFAKCLRSIHGKDFIFQLDGENGNKHLDSANEYEVPRCFGLFDVSGGAGILPAEWPTPIYLDVHPGEHGMGEEQWAYHGYAGGLGPENLEAEIPRILKAAAGNECTAEGRIWIDMETRVRSEDDRQFDLAKVRRCLEIASRFVAIPSPTESP